MFALQRRDVVLVQPNRDLDGNGGRIIGEHEALQLWMAFEIATDGRQNECGSFRSGVLSFDDDQLVEGEEIRPKLRSARAVLAAKEFVWARRGDVLEKIGERREVGSRKRRAAALVIERAVAKECELSAMICEFVDLAMVQLERSDQLRGREESSAASAKSAV